jgi:lysine-N-methylase
MPKLSLPTVQNWDCHGCGDCCKTYHVRVSAAEQAKIEAQNWLVESDLGGLPPMVYEPSLGSYRLNHTATGTCVFLGEGNRCKIHTKFGSAAKPLACRLYPFTLTPAGDHWAVGVRYSCPSATDNIGKPLQQHEAELSEYATLYELEAGRPLAEISPPELQPGQSVSWSDLLRFVSAMLERLEQPDVPLEYRLRAMLALASLCRKSKFDKITGERLTEFLDVVTPAILEDVPEAKQVPHPGWLGRMIFRQVLAIYCRKDNGPNPGIGREGRFIRLKAAWRFALGSGPIPALHGLMPTNVTFAEIEQRVEPLSPESEGLLTRFYRMKLESLPFCGVANFDYRFWDGLDSLLLTFPAIRWLGRVLTIPGTRSSDEAIRLAVRIIDDNFGYVPALGSSRQKWALARLSERQEIASLIAWYGE